MSNRTIESDKLVEAVEASLRDRLADIPGDSRQDLLETVAGLIERQARAERDRCVAVCRRRALLWRNTAASRSSLAVAREEARARGNEAIYLADLLESGEISDFTLRNDADA